VSKIGIDEVQRVARLARLALSDDEAERMRAQLDSILGYVAEIDALDVAGVEPTFHTVPLAAPLRPDVVVPSLPRAEALLGAPKTDEGGFAVQKVLEVE
jgi:aspartyl-tRNA(Asn)/glutamyl-tRNA(Gln) amidotransferase subunit C